MASATRREEGEGRRKWGRERGGGKGVGREKLTETEGEETTREWGRGKQTGGRGGKGGGVDLNLTRERERSVSVWIRMQSRQLGLMSLKTGTYNIL